MSFIFNAANNDIISGSLNLFVGNFDLYLVTNIPSTADIIVSDLSLVGDLVPVLLTNKFTSNIWSFEDTILPIFGYSVSPVGFVISKRMGGSSSNTDPVIYYSEFTNSLAQPIIYSTGLYRINVQFVSTGLITFLSTYEYFSGSYINNEIVPKGLVYLLGTNNNTVDYVNPQPSKIESRYKYSGGSGVSGVASTNRNPMDFSGTAVSRVTFFFYNKQIRLGVFGYNSPIANSTGLSIYGSNSLTSHIDSEIDTVPNWTLLGTVSSVIIGMNFINSNSNTYWSYLKLESNDATTDNIIFGELEFYSSSIISPTLNLI